MSDTCRHCEVRGNIVDCRNTPCHTHESWYAQQQDAEIERLEALLTQVLVVEGRCPTRLLIEISKALAGKETKHEPE